MLLNNFTFHTEIMHPPRVMNLCLKGSIPQPLDLRPLDANGFAGGFVGRIQNQHRGVSLFVRVGTLVGVALKGQAETEPMLWSVVRQTQILCTMQK